MAILKYGEKCPSCGAKQESETNERCHRCNTEFVDPPQPLAGAVTLLGLAARGRTADASGWQCCFCGQSLEPHDTARIVIYPTPVEDEWQEVRAHRSCLAGRLHSSVALHPALETEVN